MREKGNRSKNVAGDDVPWSLSNGCRDWKRCPFHLAFDACFALMKISRFECGIEEQFATVCDILALDWSIENTKHAVGAEVRRNNDWKSLRDKINASWGGGIAGD